MSIENQYLYGHKFINVTSLRSISSIYFHQYYKVFVFLEALTNYIYKLEFVDMRLYVTPMYNFDCFLCY